MAGHAQLKFVMTECSKTQIRLAGLKCFMEMAAGVCFMYLFLFCKRYYEKTLMNTWLKGVTNIFS